jgi:hypothetical protein|tara:strand:+ start:240 stop:509 length:270 start_codon:yes stop_codon:yes gene_type:complete
MKNFFLVLVVVSLIFLTTSIKNSTKNIDKKIFETKENILLLEDKYELLLLDYNYLSSPSKLIEFNEKYFDQKLKHISKSDIQVLDLRNE